MSARLGHLSPVPPSTGTRLPPTMKRAACGGVRWWERGAGRAGSGPGEPGGRSCRRPHNQQALEAGRRGQRDGRARMQRQIWIAAAAVILTVIARTSDDATRDQHYPDDGHRNPLAAHFLLIRRISHPRVRHRVRPWTHEHGHLQHFSAENHQAAGEHCLPPTKHAGCSGSCERREAPNTPSEADVGHVAPNGNRESWPARGRRPEAVGREPASTGSRAPEGGNAPPRVLAGYRRTAGGRARRNPSWQRHA